MAVALVIAGVVCALYGVAVMMVGSGTWFFAFWYALAAVLMAAGWGVHAGVWSVLPQAARRAVEMVLALALVGFIGVQAFIARDFNDQGEDGLDYIVVLGAQVYEWGPSPVLRYRLDAAYDYLVANPATTCIVSGGQGFNEPVPEAQGMAAYLAERGIAPDRVIVEAESLNTAQNIRNSMRFFNPETARVGIVTNNFHMARALAMARKAGIRQVCGISAGSDPVFLPNSLVRESLSIVKALIVGDL